MVGREDQGDGAWIPPGREAGRDRDRGGGIAPLGLEHDVGLDADSLQLFGRDETHVMVARTTIRPKPSPETRLTVVWKDDSSPISGMNCLGMLSRDAGHRRVPAPPHMMIGMMSPSTHDVAASPPRLCPSTLSAAGDCVSVRVSKDVIEGTQASGDQELRVAPARRQRKDERSNAGRQPVSAIMPTG